MQEFKRKQCVSCAGCIKKELSFFLYISASIKATEIVIVWDDRGDLTVRFGYKTDSE